MGDHRELPSACWFTSYLFAYYFPNSLLKIILMLTSPNRSPVKSEPSDESDTNRKPQETSRKKKKEKKKKRKLQRHKKTKRKRGPSGSSESESDTDSEKDSPSRSVRDSKRESEKPK